MSDNKRNTRTMEFELTDAAALMHAFSIAACTARLCGHPDADKRLQQYKKLMEQFVPPEAKFFDEEAWCEIGIALVDAERFYVALEPKRWERDKSWWSDGVIAITVGNRRWESDGRPYFKRGAPEVKAVYRVLSELAPMGCVGECDDHEEKKTW